MNSLNANKNRPCTNPGTAHISQCKLQSNILWPVYILPQNVDNYRLIHNKNLIGILDKTYGYDIISLISE